MNSLNILSFMVDLMRDGKIIQIGKIWAKGYFFGSSYWCFVENGSCFLGSLSRRFNCFVANLVYKGEFLLVWYSILVVFTGNWILFFRSLKQKVQLLSEISNFVQS